MEDKVVFVNSAGNNSALRNNLVAKAENSGSIRSALRNDLENEVKKEKKRQCGNLFNRIGKFFTTGDPCRTVTVTTSIPTPPLKNLLVVEALNVTGDYANYSFRVSNKALAVRAFGDASTPCPINRRDSGFPALSSNGRVVCMKGGGTSSAAPQVAGLAAWLWSQEGNLSAPQVVERIRSSQTKFKILNAQGEPTNQDSQQTAINVPKTLGIN